MDSADRDQLIAYLKSQHLWLTKRAGQHFLVDRASLAAMIAAADVQPGVTVVEIGPGIGTLTEELIKSPAGLILAIERDPRLVARLRDRFLDKRVKFIHQDVLTFRFDQVAAPWQVVANIPYQITGAILRQLTDIHLLQPPQSLTLLVQKEVADRLLAQPGDRARGMPTLLLELYGAGRRVIDVPAQSFFPMPAVDSAVIRVVRHAVPPVAPALAERMIWLAKMGFVSKRRTIENGLAAGLRQPKPVVRELLVSAAVAADQRAEDLDLAAWRRLAETIDISELTK